jgi:hypothetical protein
MRGSYVVSNHIYKKDREKKKKIDKSNMHTR